MLYTEMEPFSAADGRVMSTASTSAGGGKVPKRLKQQAHSQSPQPRNVVRLSCISSLFQSQMCPKDGPRVGLARVEDRSGTTQREQRP